MSVPTITIPVKNLLKLGLKNTESIHYQSSPEELVQDTIRIGEPQRILYTGMNLIFLLNPNTSTLFLKKLPGISALFLKSGSGIAMLVQIPATG